MSNPERLKVIAEDCLYSQGWYTQAGEIHAAAEEILLLRGEVQQLQGKIQALENELNDWRAKASAPL